MVPNLHKALYEDKQILENLAEYYVYDFSEFLEIDLSPSGKFGFYSLEQYWNDTVNHHPFIIKLSDIVIGFVLVKKIESDREIINTIAEFFITKRYRRHGFGESVSRQIFDMFKGTWEVTQIEKNIPAQSFWRKVISVYTRGSYEEKFYDGKFHHSFVSK